MKLRWRFAPRQQVFGLLAVTMLATAIRAFAQDTIIYRDERTQEGQVVGVSGATLQLKVGAATVSVPLANVREVKMQAPAGYAEAEAAYASGDHARALAGMRAVSEKYSGLPADWARQAAAAVGEIYVAMGRLPEAEAAYRAYEKAYPGAASALAEVGMARIAVSRKDYAAAKRRLEPITAAALKERAVPAPAIANATSQAFYLLGQVHEAEGDHQAALTDYARTVSIFHHDRVASAAAQTRADALRKEYAVTVP